jgi:hypothetical protein
MPSMRIQKIIVQSRYLQSAAYEKSIRARELCEISQNLIYRNADFREFLQENLVNTLCSREVRWQRPWLSALSSPTLTTHFASPNVM